MSNPSGYTFLNPDGLSRILIASIYVSLGLLTLISVSGLFSFGYVRDISLGSPGDHLGPYELLGVLAVLCALVSFFLALKWTYRVSRNAHSFAEGLGVSPTGAVGWYFVPIACLWKPFQALSEAWQASANPSDWRRVATPGLLRWWWGLWLALVAMNQFRDRLTEGLQRSLPGGASMAVMETLCLLCLVSAGLLFIAIVRRLTRMQLAHVPASETLPATGLSPTP